jgi:dephospho-CoA kinase
MAKAAAEARIKAQSPAEEKITRADVVINTDGLMQETEQQFAQAWTRILNIE